MNLTLTHPVIADAAKRGSEEPCLAVGTVQTPVEIAEYSASDVERAFKVGGHPLIVAMGGALWTKSNLTMRDLSEGGFQAFSKVKSENLLGIFWKFAQELGYRNGLNTMGGVQITPRPAARIADWDISEADVAAFVKRAGPLARRRLGQMDEAGIELWRDKVRDSLGYLAIFDGVVYERCHEPLLVVAAGRVTLDDTSIYGGYLDHVHLDGHGFAAPEEKGKRSDVHLFPADADEEVMRFAEMIAGGEAPVNWFTVECHGKCSSMTEILEREAVRFAYLHSSFFDDVRCNNGRDARTEFDRELSIEGSDLRTWGEAIEKTRKAVSGGRAGERCFDDIAAALGQVALAARVSERFAVGKQQDDRKKLATNTEFLMSRLDDIDISLEVRNIHAPKGQSAGP